MQLSVAVRNSRLDAIETRLGVSPVLEIRSGAAPANCAAADSGTVLATLTLPSDWLAAAAAGSKSKAGTWEDTSADATGTAAHFRIKAAGSPTVCHIQGSITMSGSSPAGDMVLDNTSLAAAQAFSITAFTLTDGNA